MLSLSLVPETPRPLVVLTAVSVALTLLTLIWFLSDPRLIDGVQVVGDFKPAGGRFFSHIDDG